MDFIRTKVFFELLNEHGIRESSIIYQNLVDFLALDVNIYKQGLPIKKIEKVIKECKINQYLQSIGLRKRHKEKQKILGQNEDEIDDEVVGEHSF